MNLIGAVYDDNGHPQASTQTGHAGVILVVVPNNTAVGAVLDVQMPAANGITVNGGANSPS